MPRLMGEEALQAARETAVGTGALEPSTQKETVRTWQKAAGVEPKPQRATLADLGAMGFGIHQAN